MKLRMHGKIILSLTIFTIFVTQCIELDKNFYMQSTSQTLKVISELPSQNDVFQYINALRQLIKFVSTNMKCLDFSMKFGLFLLNVNLRSFLLEENLVPLSLRNEVRSLVEEADKLHYKYDYKLSTQPLAELMDVVNITQMYVSMATNDTAWSQHILRLDLDLLREIYSYSYKFPEWDKYEQDLEDPLKWMPDMTLGNKCLAQLAATVAPAEEFSRCKLSKDCLDMLDFGYNYGYVLSFKLLFLLLARLSRKCTVFSVLQDERVRHHLCKSAYRESEFIADNDFRKNDLMAEHISFCTLDGHAQFLRTSWMSRFLEHQTTYGYFSSNISAANIKTKFANRQQEAIGDDTCMEHINAVMVGALAAAIRFILENYH